MTDTKVPIIKLSFLNIHKVITRGIHVSLEQSRLARSQGFKDPVMREGFINYVRAFIAIINAHHLSEDEIAFPFFKDKLPEVPFAMLSENHQTIEGYLEEMKLGLEQTEDNATMDSGLGLLENAFAKLDALWHPHIKIEEEQFIPKVDGLLTLDEQMSFMTTMAEHGQKNANPPYLTMPFMLYNLAGEDRKAFSQNIPPEVLNNLIPVVWKPQWESMKPYFLE